MTEDANAVGPLAGKTVVVTGVASGIGRESAAEIRRQGANVIGVDLNPSVEVDEFVKADLSDPDSIAWLVGQLPDGVDGLVNVAGVPPTAPAEMVIRVNLRGLQELTLRMIPKLGNGAAIVNLASSAGGGWATSLDLIGEFESVDWDGIAVFADRHDLNRDGRSYFFSKEALVVWTMKHRWSWRDRGIRMNCVSPGPVDTPILPDFLETLGERATNAMRVLDRPGRPDDVAPVVAFLLSDAAGWFRGANLTPDGGLSAYLALRAHGIE